MLVEPTPRTTRIVRQMQRERQRDLFGVEPLRAVASVGEDILRSSLDAVCKGTYQKHPSIIFTTKSSICDQIVSRLVGK